MAMFEGFSGFSGTIASLFGMDDDAWERHANPWSVWTRIATWPLLMLVLWSFHWWGAWSLLPLGVLAGWIALNPRAFPPPASTKSWASRAVMGERVYLQRESRPIPVYHANAAQLLSIGSGVGALVMGAGLLTAEPTAYLVGGVATLLCKLWFVDRMAWLYDDTSREVTEYRDWLR
jgi:hypothetical protein